MRKLEDLSQEEILWLKDRCGKFPRYELAGVLEIDMADIDDIMNQLGVGHIHFDDTHRDTYGIYTDIKHKQGQTYSVPQSHIFRKKVEKVKNILPLLEGQKIGQYTLIKTYPYHCLVLNRFNVRESISYADITKICLAKGLIH